MGFKERLSNLLCIKSLVTLALTGVFCYLSVIGVIDKQLFYSVFSMVIGFYFGTQAMKTKGETNNGETGK